MQSKLPNPLFVELPSELIPCIKSIGDVFYFHNIRLELRKTQLFLKIQTWKGVELCHEQGVDVKPFIKELQAYALIPAHQILIIKLRAA